MKRNKKILVSLVAALTSFAASPAAMAYTQQDENNLRTKLLSESSPFWGYVAGIPNNASSTTKGRAVYCKNILKHLREIKDTGSYDSYVTTYPYDVKWDLKNIVALNGNGGLNESNFMDNVTDAINLYTNVLHTL